MCKVQEATSIKNLFYNEKIHIRFVSLFVLFLLVFNGSVIISYYLLAEGFLLGKNSILDWSTSNNIVMSAIQIFAFNLISVVLAVFANFFAFPSKAKAFMPLGYWVLIILYAINGVTLGTWSFTAANTSAPDLISRLLGTFDVMNRAGLWEMVGQILITSATARIAIIRKENQDVYISSRKEIHIGKTEILVVAIGICLMLTGAFVESNAIVSLK